MQIIKPIEYLEITSNMYPIFLAWPIAGAWWWQEVATKYIEEKTKNISSQIVIIDPSRYIINWKSEKKLTPWYEYRFSRQREWERFYLDNTANNWWTILFWLPTQKNIIPNNPDWTQKKSYASTTRQELWTAMIRYPESVVVWIDEKFPERSIIEDDLKFYTNNPDFPIYSSLEKVIEIIISKIR